MSITLCSVRRFMPGNSTWRLPRDQLRPPGDRRVQALVSPVVDRQHVVLHRLDQPQPLQRRQLSGISAARSLPASGRTSRRRAPRRPRRTAASYLRREPRRAVPGDRAPAPVVDATVAEHLEVLQVVPLGRVGRRRSCRPCSRPRSAPAGRRSRTWARAARPPRGSSARRRSRARTAAHLALARDAGGPVHDRAVARAAPVRRDLLGPLERRTHRPRPAHRVVVVRLGRAELVLTEAMNSGVSSAAMPLKLAISLKAPLSVPSAEAPLSPMM